MRYISLVFCMVIAFMAPSFAANMDVILDSTNGSSAMVVRDSTTAEVTSIDSDGNVLVKGGMRVSASGTKITTANNLIVDGKMGIGTASPGSSLEVNGDLKLASIAAPTPGEGKIFYSSSTKRLNYHDGSMWIEIDPAYTTKEVKMLYDASAPTVSSVVSATFSFGGFTAPGNGIIITGFNMIAQGTADFGLKMELLDNDVPKATCIKSFEKLDPGASTVWRNYGRELTIPVKVDASHTVKLKVSRVITGTSMIVRDATIEYIELPF
jgi:hypothetical protein